MTLSPSTKVTNRVGDAWGCAGNRLKSEELMRSPAMQIHSRWSHTGPGAQKISEMNSET